MLQTPGNLCLIFAEKKIMEQLHAHEVLHMMEGNSYYGCGYPHRISEEERKIHAGRKWVYSRHK